MGNRAVVKFQNAKETHGIYLHWNGGPESVLAFLKVMEDRGWTRQDYASARFTGVVTEFFDADGSDDRGLSLGIVEDAEAWADGSDNGLYEVTRSATGWDVRQNGDVLSKENLSARELAQYQGIIDLLAKLRKQRQEMAEKEI